MLKRLFLIVAVALMVSPVLADPIELVVNGEFEPPPSFTGQHWMGNDSQVPGWSNTSGRFELFHQGAHSSPPVGSDGLPTGQHCEITVNDESEVISQVVTVPDDYVFADFSFDMWPRFGSGVDFSLVGTASGTILSDSVTGPSNAWTPYSATGLPIIPGEAITLSFQSIGGGGAGAHIDAVSMVAYTPEPSTLGLSILGILAFARRRRRKN